MNLAQITLGGRLTADPIDKKIGESTLCEFSVAVNERYKDKERTSFFDVKAWGKQGEVIAKHFRRGKEILVIGRVEQETWEKDGQRRSKHIVVCERFQFVGAADKGGQNEPAGVLAGATEVSSEDTPF